MSGSTYMRRSRHHYKRSAKSTVRLPAGLPADGIPDEALDVLTDLQTESDYIHANIQRYIDHAKELRRRADIDTDLHAVNRADVDRLLRNKNLSQGDRTAICIFLDHVKSWPWLKIENRKFNLVPRIGIAVLSPWSYGRQLAKCGLKGGHCQQPDFCFLCSWMLRREQSIAEYSDLYARCADKGYFIYALTASYEINPGKAGLHFVVKKGDRTLRIPDTLHHLRRYLGKRAAPALTPDAGHLNALKACFEAGFKLNSLLLRRHLILGAIGHRALDLGFQPLWALAHTHSLIITREPIIPKSAEEVFYVFERIYAHIPKGRRLYPDLHISPLPNQYEINSWLNYLFLPVDYLKGYVAAVKRGVDLWELNTEVDDRVFQGGDEVLREVTSPRRIGRLRVNVPGYLGTGDTITRRRAQAKQKRDEKRARKQTGRPPVGRAEADRRLGADALADAEG